MPQNYHINEQIINLLNESNLIEGVTDVQSLGDAITAWNFVLGLDKIQPGYIEIAHALLMKNQDHIETKYKGRFRDCPVWVGHRECMKHYMLKDAMVDWCNDVNMTQPQTEEQFLYFHVRFEKIHPFIDGNGRIGRILLAWHQAKHNFPITLFLAGEKHEKYYPLFDQMK